MDNLCYIYVEKKKKNNFALGKKSWLVRGQILNELWNLQPNI